MMDVAESEMFKNFTVLNKDFLFLINLNKTAVQSIPKYSESLQNSSYDVQLRYSAPAIQLQTSSLDTYRAFGCTLVLHN